MDASILKVEGLSRAFSGVPVLSDVSLELWKGKVLGLIGQNGAGKSTLMNIIGGVLSADSGAMQFKGEPYAPVDPREAGERGIGFIHQELNLFTNLTIAENIFIDGFPRRGFGPFALIDRAALRTRTAELLSAVDLDLAPDTPVERLSPGERQLVEVAKALQLNADVIIFDEPTTSLTARETAKLFALIKRLKGDGKAIIYISHILADVRAVADDVAVLRDGNLVGTGAVEEFPVSRMINLMLGRDIDQLFPERNETKTPEVLLETRGISARGVVKDISIQLHKGEVLGLFGLMGSGRTELARMLFGLDGFDSGEIVGGGTVISHNSPQRAISEGMAFITENRREEGLLMNVAVSENIVLAALPKFSSSLRPFLDEDRMLASASELAATLKIKSGAIASQPVKSLSGGNQQKVVIARWLLAGPKIFILDEPTRGIDVAAKLEIYSMVDTLAGEGRGILFISSEIDELSAMCDRLLVMSRGEIVAEFERAAFDREAILRAAFREQEQAA